jgi:hypothetical protein
MFHRSSFVFKLDPLLTSARSHLFAYLPMPPAISHDVCHHIEHVQAKSPRKALQPAPDQEMAATELEELPAAGTVPIKGMVVKDLREQLASRGLESKGKKADLVARLVEAVGGSDVVPIEKAPPKAKAAKTGGRASKRGRSTPDAAEETVTGTDAKKAKGE